MSWQLKEGQAYLTQRDARMALAIQEIGTINRGGVEPLFEGLMDSIIGQQITMKAADTVSRRLRDALGALTPESVALAEPEVLAQCGMSRRKAGYLQSAVESVRSGQVSLEALLDAEDEECIRALSSLRGVGRWTAEMLLIFSLERPDVMSYDDYGIRKGLCLLYHHRELTKSMFERYRRRFSPYGTAASLYLWEIAVGRAPISCAKSIRGGKK